MKKNILITLLLFVILAAPTVVAEGDGGYAGAFLQVPVGARPTGMGGAYISVSNDGAGMFYNPAGLSSIKKKIFASSYRVMKLDRTLGYTAFIFPARGNSIIGLSWLYAGSGSLAARDINGYEQGYEISQDNHYASVVFAKRFERFLSLGFRGSYLHTNFSEMSAFSVSFDFGAIVYLSQLLFDREERDLMAIQDIQAGIIFRNLSATYKWNNNEYYKIHGSGDIGNEQFDDVPLEIGLGASARFINRKLLLSSDLVKNTKQGIVLHSGAEYFLTPAFGLRTGYTDKSLTAGFGYVFSLKNFGLALDYAFSSEKVEEGSEHIFSFDILF